MANSTREKWVSKMSSFSIKEDLDTVRYLYGVSPCKKRGEKDEDVDSVMHFWQSNLLAYCRFNRVLCFSSKEIEKGFSVESYNANLGAKEQYIPGHLQDTLEELVRREEVVTAISLRAWYKANTKDAPAASESAASSASLPLALLATLSQGLWGGISKLTSSAFVPQCDKSAAALGGVGDQSGFISVALLRVLEDAILGLAQQRNQRDLVFLSTSTGKACDETLTFWAFLLEVAAAPACSEDIRDLLTGFGERDVQLLGYYLMKRRTLLESVGGTKGVKIVKIITRQAAAAAAATCIMPEEISRLTLRASIANIDRQLETNRHEIDACAAKAAKHSRDKQSKLGMYEFEKRKTLLERQDELSRKYMILDRALDSVQHGIDAAEMNRLVQEAYISAASGLRSIAKCGDVTVESFEAAEEAFELELEKLNEVAEVVGRMADMGVEEREELERQFEDFMAAPPSALVMPRGKAPAEEDKRAEVSDIPEVPKTPIRVTSSAAAVSAASTAPTNSAASTSIPAQQQNLA